MLLQRPGGGGGDEDCGGDSSGNRRCLPGAAAGSAATRTAVRGRPGAEWSGCATVSGVGGGGGAAAPVPLPSPLVAGVGLRGPGPASCGPPGLGAGRRGGSGVPGASGSMFLLLGAFFVGTVLCSPLARDRAPDPRTRDWGLLIQFHAFFMRVCAEGPGRSPRTRGTHSVSQSDLAGRQGIRRALQMG